MGSRTPHVVILGAGPAGLGAAFELRRRNKARVTVLEQRKVVGGNSGSFELAGQCVDYGSHRLHPSCDAAILADIREFLGNELLERSRHGRIRLLGRWVHFPLKPLDLLLKLDRSFAMGAMRDLLQRVFSPALTPEEETFASVLQARLGRTICKDFYFPYARKIWGCQPDALSAVQAHRRVAADSIGKLLRKILGQIPGVSPVGFHHFFYPSRGFGAISGGYAKAAQDRGAQLRLGSRVTRLEQPAEDCACWRVVVESGAKRQILEADYVWSTIPITLLAKLVAPPPPPAVMEAAAQTRYRSMVLIYLTLGVDRFTEFDAHYFPGWETPISRLSEPKNYSGRMEPRNRTTLCAELPCSPEDPWWTMSDDELGAQVATSLEHLGLHLPGPLQGVHVCRLSHAYPICATGYEADFSCLDRWVRTLPRLLTYGRQGLFQHDNTHHALYMAYAAVDSLTDAGFDDVKWAAYRKVFESHVVED